MLYHPLVGLPVHWTVGIQVLKPHKTLKIMVDPNPRTITIEGNLVMLGEDTNLIKNLTPFNIYLTTCKA